MKRILVTGSSGYIGTTLCPRLADMGYVVLGVDTGYYAGAGVGENRGITVISQDIRNLKVELSEIDTVIHLAALSNDPLCRLREQLTYRINHQATIDLAVRAKKSGVKRFIFSSTVSVYGNCKAGIVTEKTPPRPISAYGRSKHMAETDLAKLADTGFWVGIMRNPTVYGYSPVFRDDLVINNFVTEAVLTGKIKVHSDGTPWRPVIDVRDLSDCIIGLMRKTPGILNGRAVNVGFGRNNFRVSDLAEKVSAAMAGVPVLYDKIPLTDKRSYRVDTCLFQEQIPAVVQKWSVYRSVRDLVSKYQSGLISRGKSAAGYYNRIKSLEKLMESNLLDGDLYWTAQKT